MQIQVASFIGMVLLSLSLAACNDDSDPNRPQSDVPVALNDDVKTRGYHVNQDSVTFIVDETAQKDMLVKANVSEIKSIDLRGSFTAWQKKDGLEFTKSATNPGVWYLTQPLAALAAPGNSGRPEFKFVVTGTVGGAAESTAWLEVGPNTPLGYHHFGNHMVTLPTDDLNTLIANNIAAETLKTLDDFNLATDAGKANLSNFRPVPGTAKVYRGYHPYKKSYPDLDTETPRLALVNQFMSERGVKSVITLSGVEAPDPAR